MAPERPYKSTPLFINGIAWTQTPGKRLVGDFAETRGGHERSPVYRTLCQGYASMVLGHGSGGVIPCRLSLLAYKALSVAFDYCYNRFASWRLSSLDWAVQQAHSGTLRR